jgi:hypothetical protein
VLRSEAAFHEYFHEMLLPTVNSRHEQLARVSSRDELERVFENGYLLAAYKDTEWVAANLITTTGKREMRSANVGWRGGDERLMKERVVSALVLEMIRRGKDEGFEVLNLGSSNPFVDDGPLNYKLKWGAHMEFPSIGYAEGALHGMRRFLAARFSFHTEAGRAMLQHSPLLEKRHGRLQAIGWRSSLRPDFRHQIDQGLPWVDLAG